MAKKSAKKTATRRSAARDRKEAAKDLGAADRQIPTDVARPSASADDVTEGTGDQRPTAREGLRPTGNERPHPTAAARPGKTAGEATRQSFEDAREDTAEARVATRREERERLGKVIRVRATKMGFYDNVRRRTGDVFDIREDEFSKLWMVAVDGRTPTRVTTSAEALEEEQGRRKVAKAGERAARTESASAGIHTGRTDVETAATGTRNPLGADAR